MATSDWDANGLDVFFKTSYTYDDAATLASLWGIPIVEAKQAIGHKVINKIEDLLPIEVQKHSKLPDDGMSKTYRAYANSGYDYDDAELLASLWDMSIVEAKETIGFKVLNGLEANLPSKISPDNKAIHEKHDNGAARDTFKAFANSGYDYDDAVMLASLWDMSIVEAKETIGFKVLNGLEANLPSKIVPDNKTHNDKHENDNQDSLALSVFFKSDYTYYDAELLAQLWNISLVESKKTIGYKILNKIEDLLPVEVKNHKAGKTVDDKFASLDAKALDTFDNSRYTYDDAELLAQLWGISTFEAKKVIGSKIMNNIEHLLPSKLPNAPRG